MKRAFTAVLIACLVAAPLAGCATVHGPREIEEPSRGPAPGWNWSRLRELAPGREVSVAVKGSPPGRRYFLAADAAGVVVLNLTDASLPAAAARVLRDLASRHAEQVAAVRTNASFQEGDVRLTRDGVFVADRKVADTGRVVETIARGDIVEIRGPVVARGSVPGAVLGAWLGFAAGVVPGLGGVPEALAWPLLIGCTALGGFLGSHWSSHETEGVIYRGP